MLKSPQQDVLPFSLQLIALKDVVPSPGNSKIHTPEQIDAIIRSIKEFGFRDPIALDGNFEIVEGHGRVAALLRMGAVSVPALVFNDMTHAQIRAYRIAHNQLALSTGFDFGALAVELRDLETSGSDITLTGFSMEDLNFFELHGSGVVPVEGKKKIKEDAAEGGEEKIKVPALSVAQYVMLFDGKEQQSRWTVFLKYLKANVEGDTIAERVDNYLKAQGF